MLKRPNTFSLMHLEENETRNHNSDFIIQFLSLPIIITIIMWSFLNEKLTKKEGMK